MMFTAKDGQKMKMPPALPKDAVLMSHEELKRLLDRLDDSD